MVAVTTADPLALEVAARFDLSAANLAAPGTADPDAGTLYLHLLHHNRAPETIEHVKKIARLACDAKPLELNRAHP